MFYQQMYTHGDIHFYYVGYTVYFGGETGSEGLITSGIVWDTEDKKKKKIRMPAFAFLSFRFIKYLIPGIPL